MPYDPATDPAMNPAALPEGEPGTAISGLCLWRRPER